jgi:hypothetical protein
MVQSTLPPEVKGRVDEVGVLYCANHPQIETLLRCNKCEKPICMKCAVQTPVGYRCKECVRQQQNIYFNAEAWDNPIALVVSFLVTVVATPLVSILFGFVPFFFSFIIAFALGAGAGGLLAQIIRRAVGRRRGRALPYFALAGILAGFLVGAVGPGLILAGVLTIPNIGMLIFAFLAITTAYQILR